MSKPKEQYVTIEWPELTDKQIFEAFGLESDINGKKEDMFLLPNDTIDDDEEAAAIKQFRELK